MGEHRGFFGSLFDISFTEFVTTRIIKFLYILFMVVIGIGTIAGIVMAFISSIGFGFLTLLVLAPIGFLLYLILARVWLELIIIIFRIAENTGRLVEQNKSK